MKQHIFNILALLLIGYLAIQVALLRMERKNYLKLPPLKNLHMSEGLQ